MPRNRRALLKTVGLAAASGSLTAIPGCLDTLPGKSGATPDSTPSTTKSSPDEQSVGDTEIVQWLPDPTETSIHDGYSVVFYDHERISDYEGVLDENIYEYFEGKKRSHTPLYWAVNEADITATIALDRDDYVTLGSFDAEAIGEELTHIEDFESYRGFDLYGDEGISAVSDEAILSVSYRPERDASELAKAIIDTRADDGPTYRDGNDYAKAQLDLVDSPHVLECYVEDMEGTSPEFQKEVKTGVIRSWEFGEDTTTLTYGYTYPDSEAATNNDLEAYIESEAARFGPYDGLEVTTDGLLAWAEGTVPTEEFDRLGADEPDGATTSNS